MNGIGWEMIAEHHHYLGGSTKLSKLDYAWCPKWSNDSFAKQLRDQFAGDAFILSRSFQKNADWGSWNHVMLQCVRVSFVVAIVAAYIPSPTSSKPSIYSKY